MSDERIRAQMRSLETDDVPRQQFVDDLHADLARRLGLAPAGGSTRAAPASLRSSRALLLAATIGLLIALVGALAAFGAFQNLLPDREPVLRLILRTGDMLVAIRPDLPQVLSPSGTLGGFDIELAEEFAGRLGVDLVPVVAPPEEILGRADWQVALLGEAYTRDLRPDYLASTPYYSWPYYLVVKAEDSAVDLADLADTQICAVAASEGARWLSGSALAAGMYLGSDETTCSDDLSAGRARAYVSDTSLLSDFASLGGVRVLQEEPVVVAPRVMIVPRTLPGAQEFVTEINRVLSDLRSDGTLADLSRAWFGGQDLTR